jgi:hypothetical protein
VKEITVRLANFTYLAEVLQSITPSMDIRFMADWGKNSLLSDENRMYWHLMACH